MINPNDFYRWAEEFNMKDDGYAAFVALNKLSLLEFEFAMRGEGWIGRAEEILAG